MVSDFCCGCGRLEHRLPKDLPFLDLYLFVYLVVLPPKITVLIFLLF